METFVFIHGSSAGQCSLSFDPTSNKLCSEIGKYYFEGRDNRILMDFDGAAMFAELFRSSDNQIFCLYSYVINTCLGPAPDLRAGNYFALTIAVKGNYCKETSKVYKLLVNAYNQIICGRVIEDTLLHAGKTYRHVYKVPQLQNIEKNISGPLGKVLEFFNRDCEPFCSILPSSARFPLPWNGGSLTTKNGNNVVRLPWNGISFHPDECDSREAISHLLTDGRIIVHEKAERYAERLQRLINEKQQIALQVNSLQQQLESAKRQYEQQKESAVAARKNAAEMERLKVENRQLQERLDKYDNLIDQLSKYQRTTQSKITNVARNFQTAATQSSKNTRWLKSIVLMLILLISIVCLVLNICFFRSMPSSGETSGRQNTEKNDTNEIIHNSGDTSIVEELHPTAPENANKSTPNFGLSVMDNDGKIITKVSPGQLIRAKVNMPQENCRFHFLNCHQKGDDSNPIWIIIDTADASSNVIINYKLWS